MDFFLRIDQNRCKTIQTSMASVGVIKTADCVCHLFICRTEHTVHKNLSDATSARRRVGIRRFVHIGFGDALQIMAVYFISFHPRCHSIRRGPRLLRRLSVQYLYDTNIKVRLQSGASHVSVVVDLFDCIFTQEHNYQYRAPLVKASKPVVLTRD